jgi:hypothetical protein
MTKWCFAPEGGLAIGDVLPAQKVALERWNETDVVFCSPSGAPMRPAASNQSQTVSGP